MIAPIPPAPGAVRPSVAAVVEGLRFARRRREVLATFIVDLNAMVFGSARSLFPALALDVFRSARPGSGSWPPPPASGRFIGAVFSGWTTTVRRPGRAVLIAVAVWGLGIVGFGLSTFSFPLALVFLAIAERRGRDQRGAAQLDRADPDARRVARTGVVDPHPGRHRRAAHRQRRGERRRRR